MKDGLWSDHFNGFGGKVNNNEVPKCTATREQIEESGIRAAAADEQK